MWKIRKYTYSELGLMGDLRDYRLQQLPFYFKKMQMEEISRNEFILVRIWNKYTEYILKYDLNGVFIQIVNEKWINYIMLF